MFKVHKPTTPNQGIELISLALTWMDQLTPAALSLPFF